MIGKYPEQYASQMNGRLLSHEDEPAIEELLERLRGTPPPLPVASLAHARTGLFTDRRLLEGHTGLVYAVALSADGGALSPPLTITRCVSGTSIARPRRSSF